jgi:hypothetical protein
MQHIPVDMVGGSPAHAALSARLASLIDQGLPQDSPCVVYSSDVKLKLAEDHYLLIGSEEKKIVVYRRENQWRPSHYNQGDLSGQTL